jgi:enoyl-CoA hydratase/carnithine racemase
MIPEPTSALELDTLTLTPAGDGIAVLTINRPDRLNTMTVPMFTDLTWATRALRDSGVRALILTGAGERAFCAGFDLAEIEDTPTVAPLIPPACRYTAAAT